MNQIPIRKELEVATESEDLSPVGKSKPSVELVGQDGNAFAILGRVRVALVKAGYTKDEIKQYTDDAMSGDYNHLLATTMDWVNDVGEKEESLQITQRADLEEVKKAKKLRRSTRPLKKHTDVADKFLEVRKAIDDLSQQAAAVGAIIGEKERVAGNLSRELMDYAEEYKERIIQTKNIFIQLQDIPPHKAKVPAYKKVMDHMLDMLEGVSKDMRKEAEAFIEDAKREVPGETELLYKEVMKEGRTSVMGEGWAAWRKILDIVGGLAAKSRDKINAIKNDWQEFLGGLETDVWGD